MRLLQSLLLVTLVGSVEARGYVRAWIEGLANESVAGGSRTCESYRAGLRKYRTSIDELSVIGINIDKVLMPDGSLSLVKSSTGLDTMGCLAPMKQELGLRLSPCLGFTPGEMAAIAAHPEAFAAHLLNFTAFYDLDGFQLDVELKYGLTGPQVMGAERGWDMLAEGLQRRNGTLTEYKGCVRNHLPFYLGQNCSVAVRLMPHLDKVVAAGTYWNNSVDGFEALLLDEVLSVVQNPGDCGAMDCLLSGKALWRSKLSVALCPHGCAPEVSLTQEQLYARYDLMTALGISDTYLFLWNLIVPHKGVVAPDGEYWLNAMARFRSH